MRWGHITPIGGSEALLLPKTDLPNLLVRSCRVSLFDRHTQPNSYATTRPKQSDRPTPETVRVTPRRAFGMAGFERRGAAELACLPGGMVRSGAAKPLPGSDGTWN